MNKKEWRQHMKKVMAEKVKTEAALANLYHNLFTHPFWMEADSVGITISGGMEISTYPVIDKAWNEGKTVAVPKCIPGSRELHFYGISSYSQLEDSFYGLKEPVPDRSIKLDKNNMDLVIVPGLVFDKRGYRIGFGGGYYDRFLKGADFNTAALCMEWQLADELPEESHDIPVDAVLMPERIIHTDVNR